MEPQQLDLALGPAVPDDVLETIRKSIYWNLDDVDNVTFQTDSDGVLLVANYRGVRDIDEVRASIARISRDPLFAAREFPPENLHETVANASYQLDPMPALVAGGHVSDEFVGVSTYAGVVADLYLALDAYFENWHRDFGATNIILPALLSPSTLEISEYPESNSRHLNTVSHLDERRAGAEPQRHTSDSVLSPAVCQPAYRMFSGRVLTDTSVLTGYARCFRYEGRSTTSMLRSREFGVREFICLGNKQSVFDIRERLLVRAGQVLDEFGLEARVSTAADPFFAEDYADYRMYQMTFAVKHELQALIPHENRYLSLGSVNNHGTHFGQAWNIGTISGQVAHSACMGMGLDRWCYAILSQFGPSPSQWPAKLKELALTSEHMSETTLAPGPARDDLPLQ